jgi:integrase
MQEKAKLTAKLINSLKPRAKLYRIWDTDINGYFVRVSPGGTVAFCLSYRFEGKTQEHTIGRRGPLTADAARKLALAKMGELARGNDIQEEKKAAVRRAKAEKIEILRGFLESRYFPWADSNLKSASEVRRIFNRDFKQFLPKRMDSISKWDAQKWMAEQQKQGMAVSTINRRISILKSALSKAAEWEVISVSPLAGTKRLKTDDTGHVRYLDDVEESALREALSARQDHQRAERASYNKWLKQRHMEALPELYGRFTDYLMPIVLLAMNTGMRRGELFKLCWADVNLKGKLLTVKGSGAKSKTTRHIPLNDEAFNTLVTWRNEQPPSELVFPNTDTGERFTHIRRSWTKVIKDSGIEKFRFHDLRHHFASMLVMAGVDLNTVRELMGHASIEMTLRYAHLAPEHKAAAVAKLIRSHEAS